MQQPVDKIYQRWPWLALKNFLLYIDKVCLNDNKVDLMQIASSSKASMMPVSKRFWCFSRCTQWGTKWHLPCGRSYGMWPLEASSLYAGNDWSTSGAEWPTGAHRHSALQRRYRHHVKHQELWDLQSN